MKTFLTVMLFIPVLVMLLKIAEAAFDNTCDYDPWWWDER